MASILTDDDFITVAQSFEWTFAKTMPHIPHEYIVRGKTANEDTYIAMFQTIESRGEYRDWNGTQYQYLRPGDGYKYWKMTDVLDESTIINRDKDA